MKKIILSLTLAAAILTSAFAKAAEKDPGPGILVKDAFKREFARIKDVQWEEISKSGVFCADFTYNNEKIRAYFAEDGEFLGTTRVITKAQLPILVAKELDRKYPEAKVVTVFEHSMSSSLAYYITLLTAKGSMIVKADGSGDLTVHKRNRL